MAKFTIKSTVSVLSVVIITTLISNATPADSSVKPLGEACNPSVSGECGKNAICLAASPCQKGRCFCLGKNFRPVKSAGNNATDCVQVLREGDNCTAAVDADRMPQFSSCVKSTVVCQENFTGVSEDRVCSAKRRQLGLVGDACDGSTKLCDSASGLQCYNNTCVCGKGQVFQSDYTCRTSSFGESCSEDQDCAHSGALGSSPSVSASYCHLLGKEKICDCEMNNNATDKMKTTLVLFASSFSQTQLRNKGVCLRVVQTAATDLALGSSCSVPNLESFSDRLTSGKTPTAFCDWMMGYTCLHCPEDGDDPSNGRCRMIADKITERSLDGGNRRTSSSQSTFLIHHSQYSLLLGRFFTLLVVCLLISA